MPKVLKFKERKTKYPEGAPTGYVIKREYEIHRRFSFLKGFVYLVDELITGTSDVARRKGKIETIAVTWVADTTVFENKADAINYVHEKEK